MENPVLQEEEEKVPKTMADALEYENPAKALLLLAESSSNKALALSQELSLELQTLQLQETTTTTTTLPESILASVDSISHSLTKIASGGSEASCEIRILEQEKRDLEQDALNVETALKLRSCSQQAFDAFRRQEYKHACLQIQDYTLLETQKRHTPRALAYAGESTVHQIISTKERLQSTLLEKYKTAVQEGNLQVLGEVTPLLQMIQLEKEGVSLYMEYLSQTIEKEWTLAAKKPLSNTNQQQEIPSYIIMARIYNCAVSTLRHHLPMMSHCLYKADGDAALVQLVHASVEQYVIPLLQQYVRDKQLYTIATNAQRISVLLEETYTSSGVLMEEAQQQDDCGFSTQVGSMAQVNAALEEAALCLQHAESYTRFIHHCLSEIQKARKLRFQQEQESLKLQRERQEWATGVVSTTVEEQEFQPVEILAAHTQLHEVVAEVGGYYCGIERCLLLASMQRAFANAMGENTTEEEVYSPCGIPGHVPQVASRALKTSLVEKCLYAARHGMQRAFATGHSGTAAACANFCSDVLASVLLQVMTARAQESGVAPLKPGEGLLASSSSLASNILRQGQHAVHAHAGGGIDEATRQIQVQEGIAHACATLNDLQVAVHHVKHLERVLMESIEKGFAPHDAEQLRMCVKSLANVADSFQTASDSAVESLLSVLSTRVRSIVSNAVGSEGSAASASFMGSSVAGVMAAGGQIVDKGVTVRMNYNLDEQTYQLLQLSEGYMMRMCSSLDELIQPLRLHLAPRLSDATVLGVISLASKRIESAIRRCKFTALGALSLDSDMRDLMSFVKDCLDSPDLKSNVSLYRSCTPLARLMQIAKLMNVDDLEDVLDLISASKRKGNWDLKLEDAKSFLSLRVEFEGRKVNELLRISEDE